jgi:hypothetical protein
MSIQGDTATVVNWAASPTSETVRTYIVEYSRDGKAYARINEVDVISAVWIHRRAATDATGAKRCYRVRATDYWNRTSVTSEAACMLAAGRAAKTDDGEAMRSPAFLLAHKTDDHDLRASQVTIVEEDLETLIQEALRVYHKIQKLEVMGGEEGLRKRILSYGAGLAPDDPQRVIRAREFLGVVKRRFAKLLKDEL